ncbi:hypothetical protein [Aneurinibacillus tyrosinisolvens]|uniref:hypothetical protein n=1 Tax=Aneurinibacillus tyrosinisolvens TaxID=1443435 RepID=UPI00063F8904|nr:hypothetical protein [Aneurinibacillus tyrosinisolvens]
MGKKRVYEENWRQPCSEVKQGHVAVPEDFISIQQYVDLGGNPWRLNPVETARMVGTANLGFSPRDIFTLRGYYVDYDSGLNHALVDSVHAPCRFLIELYQPVRQGPRGIWAVERVTRLNR